MDWDDLRVFLTLTRAGRLSAAAGTIGQNATTVARRIQRLEHELQTRLFEKGPGGYSLTEDGHALLIRAEAIETEALGIEQAIGHRGDKLAGPIRISVAEGFGTRFLAPRLASFTTHHPDLTVDLIASTGFLDPSRRETDLAIVLARPRGGPLLVRKLTDYRLGLYASRDMAAAASGMTDTGDLLDRRLIGYIPDLIYAPELHYLAEIDGRLQATIRSASINAQAELIAAGAGIGILPRFMGDAMTGLVSLLADRISITRSFWLVVHRDARRVARVDRFIKWLGETVRAEQSLLMGRDHRDP